MTFLIIIFFLWHKTTWKNYELRCDRNIEALGSLSFLVISISHSLTLIAVGVARSKNKHWNLSTLQPFKYNWKFIFYYWLAWFHIIFLCLSKAFYALIIRKTKRKKSNEERFIRKKKRLSIALNNNNSFEESERRRRRQKAEKHQTIEWFFIVDAEKKKKKKNIHHCLLIL